MQKAQFQLLNLKRKFQRPQEKKLLVGRGVNRFVVRQGNRFRIHHLPHVFCDEPGLFRELSQGGLAVALPRVNASTGGHPAAPIRRVGSSRQQQECPTRIGDEEDSAGVPWSCEHRGVRPGTNSRHRQVGCGLPGRHPRWPAPLRPQTLRRCISSPPLLCAHRLHRDRCD